MRKHLRTTLATATSALLALVLLTQTVLAQTNTAPISVEVLPGPEPACEVVGPTTISASAGGEPDHTAIAPGGTSNSALDNEYYWPMNMQLNVNNAGCDQWSITAELTDFKLERDSTISFPGSTMRIARDGAIPNESFARHDTQPDWLADIPEDTIGNPVLPAPLGQNLESWPGQNNSIYFESMGDSYVGSTALLQANPEFSNGSPGHMSAYYVMRLFNLPTDLYLNPGIYTATLTISMQGPDD